MGPTMWIRACAAAALLSAGCTKYTFEERVPESIKEVNRVVAAGKPTPADILFVVDNSGSMADEQENLARNFDAFINEIAGAGDYQIAVVTTDLLSVAPQGHPLQGQPLELKGSSVFQFKPVEPFSLSGQVMRSCDVVDIQHGCFRGDDPSTRIITSAMPRDQQITLFQQIVRVGSCGTGNEEGLEAAVRALERTGNNECNQGFLRADANLVVVIVSDEEDSDFNGATRRPINEYVSSMQRFKGDSAAKIRVAMIVGAADGEARRCGRQATCGSQCGRMPPPGSGAACDPRSNPPTCPAGEYCESGQSRCVNTDLQFWNFCWWCSYYNAPDCCTANAGGRYVEFAQAMESAISNAVSDIQVSGCRGLTDQKPRIACLVDSICQEEFDKTLSRIAKDLIITNSFDLVPLANYPAGVVVIINGIELVRCDGTNADACDFTVTVDAEGRGTQINISGERAPKEGDNVEIFYTTAE